MMIGRILPRDVTPPTARSIKEQGKGKGENSGFEDALVTELTSAIEKTSEDGKEKSKEDTGRKDGTEDLPSEEFVAIAADSSTNSNATPKAKKINIEA